MPAEYEKFISHIFCNDCEEKTPAKYHFFYHKCGHCGSFNTTVLKTENTEETAQKAAATTTAATAASSSSALDAPSSSTSNAPAATATAVMENVSNETAGLLSNSDQDQGMQSQLGNAASNTTTPASFLGIGGYIRNPPPSSASSSSSRGRNGTESNEG